MSNDILARLDAQEKLLRQIARQLKELLDGKEAQLNPTYRRRLSEYSTFDWAAIGAQIVARDEKGVAEVEWNGHRFDRTMGEKFNDHFVIFSRPAPDWNQDNKRYYTLVKFADYNKTPLKLEPPPQQAIIPKSAPPNGINPRRTFFDTGSQAVRQGIITPDRFNTLADLGKNRGYLVALTQLQGELN